jgi:hypothetical protein
LTRRPVASPSPHPAVSPSHRPPFFGHSTPRILLAWAWAWAWGSAPRSLATLLASPRLASLSPRLASLSRSPLLASLPSRLPSPPSRALGAAATDAETAGASYLRSIINNPTPTNVTIEIGSI